jgi:acyl-CoA hydrolase
MLSVAVGAAVEEAELVDPVAVGGVIEVSAKPEQVRFGW